MAQIFKVNDHVEIVCESVNTSYGFRHDARLFVDGYEVEKAKACYHNRTWERFQYETVVLVLLEQTTRLTDEEKKKFRDTFSPER